MAEQKNTIFYGVGKSLESLGPKAWEERARKIIKEKIIPKASSEWQARLEKHIDTIAKTTGWVATGVEVGVVAGVVYGGARVIKRLRQHPVAEPQPVAPPAPKQSVIHEDLLAGLAAIAETPDPEPAIPDWLASVSIQRSHDRVVGTSNPAGPLRLIAAGGHLGQPNENPGWLEALASGIQESDRSDMPPFIVAMMKQREKSRMSEQAASHIPPDNIQAWWKIRQSFGLSTSVKDAADARKIKFDAIARGMKSRMERIQTKVAIVRGNAAIRKQAGEAVHRAQMEAKKQQIAAYEAERARLLAKQAPVKEDYFDRVREAADRLAKPRDPSNEPIVLPPESVVRDAIQRLQTKIFYIFHPKRTMIRGEPSNNPIVLKDT